MKRPKKPVVLQPVRPNVAVQHEYQRRLDAMIDAMQRDITTRVMGQYADRPPVLAQDASPAAELVALMRKLTAEWQLKFDKLAPELAAWFAISASTRSQTQLKNILKRAGFTVEFKMTAAANDTFQATVAENVGLIKSIASEHLTDVQGLVMRSVTTGRDLGPLAKGLQEKYGVTKRRAALIARDQNNKATATITRVNQQEIGIKEAIWLHSAGGLQPRRTHLAAGQRKQRYTISEGWYDPDVGKHIWPGELINCRCVSKAIIPALDD